MKSDITIAIINYNYGRFLRQAILSALRQEVDGLKIEIRVIDDGSTDCTAEVMAEFEKEPSIKWSRTENHGFAFSLSRAVSEAEGTYVFLLDADDYFAPTKVRKLLPFLKSGKLYVSDTSTYVDEDGVIGGSGLSGSTSTIALNQKAAATLLPVENEIYFSVFQKIGLGAQLSDSHTCYRKHGSSMTNRKEPGKWNFYLSRVTHNLADRLIEMTAVNSRPTWMGSSERVRRVAFEYRAQAFYNELEAHLENHSMSSAWRALYLMFKWQIYSGVRPPVLYFKMIIKVAFGKPSFPK